MFRLGLSFGEKLRESLTLNPVETFPDLMERVEQHAKLEDESYRESHCGGQRPHRANAVDAAGKKSRGQKRKPKRQSASEKGEDAETALYASRKMPKPGPEAYKAIRTLFNVPIFKMVYP